MSRRSRAARRAVVAPVCLLALALGAPSAPAVATEPPSSVPGGATSAAGKKQQREVRFATFNASLNRSAAGELVEDLATRTDPQARNVAEIVQRTRPDVLLLNEFDFVPGGTAADLFRTNYLQRGQRGAKPIRYPHAFVAPVNTGVPSGLDLDNDGASDGPGDAFGFGTFRGQYGMVVLSKYPIKRGQVRTFRDFLWKDMPGALLPDDPATPEPDDWYSTQELEVVRLSSKAHWDVPVAVPGRRGPVHFLVSHPTPPTFDGPEDRNGTRNHDEIRFWADYVAGAAYPVDDRGGVGGLPRGARFVVAGDQNSDPLDGDSVPGSIDQLLDAPRVVDPQPTSRGAVQAARRQGGANADHASDPALDTADFSDDPAPGNLRADYVLPSRGLRVRDAGVFWPRVQRSLSRLTEGSAPPPSSDHRLVWVDLRP